MFEVPTTMEEAYDRPLFKVSAKEEKLPTYVNPNTLELEAPTPFYAEVVYTSA